tara:strand:- start:139 stop:621 length:483 start_codon:yes stop_codon:yes gene_type:complete
MDDEYDIETFANITLTNKRLVKTTTGVIALGTSKGAEVSLMSIPLRNYSSSKMIVFSKPIYLFFIAIGIFITIYFNLKSPNYGLNFPFNMQEFFADINIMISTLSLLVSLFYLYMYIKSFESFLSVETVGGEKMTTRLEGKKTLVYQFINQIEEQAEKEL